MPSSSSGLEVDGLVRSYAGAGACSDAIEAPLSSCLECVCMIVRAVVAAEGV